MGMLSVPCASRARAGPALLFALRHHRWSPVTEVFVLLAVVFLALVYAHLTDP